ncbi:MAG: DUF1573 domain-containing protein [Planctomycetota bacterium]|nr:DUF1573 domain-containing protein [Planctomycetota bacterium]
MRVWLLALGSILVGITSALACMWLEFSGGVEQFEPHNQSARPPDAGNDSGEKPLPRAVMTGGTDYDFGVGQRDGSLSHEFVIKNEGRVALTLSKGPTSCKCTLSDLAQDQVPPGEIAKVKLQWKLTTTAKRFRQTAEIHTNDPALPTILFSVQGKVLDIVRLDPTELVLSSRSSGEGGKAHFRLYSYSVERFQVIEHEFTNQELAPYFSLAIQPLSADEVKQEPDAKYGLVAELTVKPGLPLGPINQTIRLTTDVPEASKFEVSVTGSVVSDIAIVGSQNFDEERDVLRLGTIAQAEGARASLRILVKGPHRRDVRMTVKETDPADVLAVSLGEATEINNGAVFMYPLTVEIPKGARPVDRLGSDQFKLGKIVIETTHPTSKIIKLYVRFSVK